MGEKYGLIITVENYQKLTNGLEKVEYANADGILMKEAFTNFLHIQESNVMVFSDDMVTKSSVQSEVRYWINTLPEDSVLYFYYAGHGFYLNGKNYCTLYDSSLLAIEDTSISFEELFLNGFCKSNGKRLVAFIDACAQNMDGKTRGIGTRTFLPEDVEDAYKRPAFEYAILCACSPGQRSFSSETLHHGVWTYHLYKDLEGKTELGEHITAFRLTEYLDKEVEKYCRNSKEAFRIQNSKSIVAGGADVEILNNCEFDEEQFVDMFYDRLTEFFIKIKRHYVERINNDNTVDLSGNYLVARDIFFELESDGVLNEQCDEWDSYISIIQIADEKLQNDNKVNLSYKEQQELVEKLDALISCL